MALDTKTSSYLFVVLHALGLRVQWSVMCLRSWVQSLAWERPPSTK